MGTGEVSLTPESLGERQVVGSVLATRQPCQGEGTLFRSQSLKAVADSESWNRDPRLSNTVRTNRLIFLFNIQSLFCDLNLIFKEPPIST